MNAFLPDFRLPMTVKTKQRCLQLIHPPCLSKDFVAIFLRYSQEHLGKVLMVIKYCWTFGRAPESRVIIYLYPGWGIIVILQIWSFKVRADAQLLACFVVGALLFLQMDLPDLVFGNSCGDSGMGNKARLTGSSSIPKSLFKEMIACCGNWKPVLSKSSISFIERMVPIFTGQMLGMLDLDHTYFCLVPLM